MATQTKTILALAALLAATWPAGRLAGLDPVTTKPSSAEQLFRDGQDAMLKGRYDEAIGLLTRATQRAPGTNSYRLNLARALSYAGREDEAVGHLETIRKADPEHVEAGQFLGRIYAKRKDYKNVVKVLEALLKYRHDYTSYHLLAEAQFNLGSHDRARTYYEKAIELNPASAADHYQLGNIYLAKGFYSLAARSYEQALALKLDSPVLRYKLASAQFNLRNYFGQVRQVTVKSGRPGTISGDVYLIEAVPGRPDTFLAAPSSSAIYHLARALADGLTDRPDIDFLRANIYLNARRYQQAYEMLGEIEKKIPAEDKALFYYYYSESAFGIGRHEEYLSLLKKAIELNEKAYGATLMEAYLRVADRHNQAGDLDKYIEYLTKAVEVSPRTAALHLKLGDAYEEARKHGLAVVQWRMVLDLEPDHPQRMVLLNRVDKHAAAPSSQPR